MLNLRAIAFKQIKMHELSIRICKRFNQMAIHIRTIKHFAIEMERKSSI